jgi:hypothetical protein
MRAIVALVEDYLREWDSSGWASAYHWATLKVSKSKPQSVGWFDELPRLIPWLGVQKTEEAEVLHA